MATVKLSSTGPTSIKQNLLCNVHHIEEAVPVIRASLPEDKNPQTQEEEGEKATH